MTAVALSYLQNNEGIFYFCFLCLCTAHTHTNTQHVQGGGAKYFEQLGHMSALQSDL